MVAMSWRRPAACGTWPSSAAPRRPAGAPARSRAPASGKAGGGSAATASIASSAPRSPSSPPSPRGRLAIQANRRYTLECTSLMSCEASVAATHRRPGASRQSSQASFCRGHAVGDEGPTARRNRMASPGAINILCQILAETLPILTVLLLSAPRLADAVPPLRRRNPQFVRLWDAAADDQFVGLLAYICLGSSSLFTGFRKVKSCQNADLVLAFPAFGDVFLAVAVAQVHHVLADELGVRAVRHRRAVHLVDGQVHSRHRTGPLESR